VLLQKPDPLRHTPSAVRICLRVCLRCTLEDSLYLTLSCLTGQAETLKRQSSPHNGPLSSSDADLRRKWAVEDLNL
jgi:hypothetical protein